MQQKVSTLTADLHKIFTALLILLFLVMFYHLFVKVALFYQSEVGIQLQKFENPCIKSSDSCSPMTSAFQTVKHLMGHIDLVKHDSETVSDIFQHFMSLYRLSTII